MANSTIAWPLSSSRIHSTPGCRGGLPLARPHRMPPVWREQADKKRTMRAGLSAPSGGDADDLLGLLRDGAQGARADEAHPQPPHLLRRQEQATRGARSHAEAGRHWFHVEMERRLGHPQDLPPTAFDRIGQRGHALLDRARLAGLAGSVGYSPMDD